MPIKIRWKSKDFIGIAFMLLGGCGLFQTFFILAAQYFLQIANYFVIIIIPIGTLIALFLASIIIFESFAEVNRRKNLRNQFRKERIDNKALNKFLKFPITKPLLITFIVFIVFFSISYAIFGLFLTNQLSFIISENIAAIVCLFIASFLEKSYAKIQRI
ncbi:MAG: hypothetical protein GF317_03795 [Candidatus Lokiarchaeota archaeon]|nr:hypothetical protein [Candidatus Lokiarchaeota archaeon]MBD3199011.1 hypothetical protein [Candidatus Lokiarchaeota archaeon]